MYNDKNYNTNLPHLPYTTNSNGVHPSTKITHNHFTITNNKQTFHGGQHVHIDGSKTPQSNPPIGVPFGQLSNKNDHLLIGNNVNDYIYEDNENYIFIKNHKSNIDYEKKGTTVIFNDECNVIEKVIIFDYFPNLNPKILKEVMSLIEHLLIEKNGPISKKNKYFHLYHNNKYVGNLKLYV